jgi:hypothetical protein
VKELNPQISGNPYYNYTRGKSLDSENLVTRDLKILV